MKRWISATSYLCQMKRCTHIWILQGIHGVLFQCYVPAVILEIPKVSEECLILKWFMHAYESDLDPLSLWWNGALGIEQVSYFLIMMNFLILWGYLMLISDVVVYFMFG